MLCFQREVRESEQIQIIPAANAGVCNCSPVKTVRILLPNGIYFMAICT